MCPCDRSIVCGYHADQIMSGLALARDTSDSGDNAKAADIMEGLRRQHGYKVELVLVGVNIGTLDLRQYGKGASRD